MAYPSGFYFELVRSSSASSLVEDAAGTHVWVRASDGKAAEADVIGGSLSAINAGEALLLGLATAGIAVRFRKAGEGWLPSDSGIVLNAVPWSGSATYRIVVPVSVTLAIGAPGLLTSSFARWSLSAGLRIPAGLVANGVALDLERIEIFASRRQVTVRVGTPGQGQDLTTAWERYNPALVIEAGGVKVEIPGPDSTAAGTRDASEPYTWTLPAADNRLSTFIMAYQRLSATQRATATATLADGKVPIAPVRMAGRLSIAGTGSSQLITANPVRLAGRLSIAGLGSVSELEIDYHSDEVRMVGRLPIAGTGSSQLITANPVRLAGRLSIAGLGSSGLITANPVRMAGRLSIAGTGSSQLITGNPVRLAGQLAIQGLGSSGIRVIQPPVAPSVSIDAVPDGLGGTEVRLRLTLTGGSYDGVSYRWMVGDGTLDNAQSATPVWTRPTTDGPVVITCTVTVSRAGHTRTETATDSVIARVVENPGLPIDRARVSARGLGGQSEIYAVEITHPDITDPVRGVADTIAHQIEGNAYPAIGFHAELPQNKEGEIRTAVLRVDNVGHDMMEWVERSKGGRHAMMRVMQIIPAAGHEANATISYEVTMPVGISEVTNQQITVNLTDDPLIGAPAVIMRHDPQTSPGIF